MAKLSFLKRHPKPKSANPTSSLNQISRPIFQAELSEEVVRRSAQYPRYTFSKDGAFSITKPLETADIYGLWVCDNSFCLTIPSM